VYTMVTLSSLLQKQLLQYEVGCGYYPKLRVLIRRSRLWSLKSVLGVLRVPAARPGTRHFRAEHVAGRARSGGAPWRQPPPETAGAPGLELQGAGGGGGGEMHKCRGWMASCLERVKYARSRSNVLIREKGEVSRISSHSTAEPRN
jgi:hypothetical protein